MLLTNKFTVLFFIAFFACRGAGMAQAVLQGRVVNQATGKPLQGVSIYFNNTSLGTSTNGEGQFSIPLPGMENAELIISSVGYERLVYKPDVAAIQNKTIVFKLTQKEVQLKDVLILTDAVRKKYLAIFEREFLGITEEASHSSIENKRDIYFTSGGSSNSFMAYSDTPLVIINKMLGYRISFELVEFFYDQQSGRTSYYGYTRFDELGEKNRWIKNRRNCYYGSTVHFFRSLIANQLQPEGYHVYMLNPVRMSGDNNNTSKQPAAQQMDVAVEVTAAQIIRADTSNINNYNYTVTVPGKLMVQYGKNPSSKNYLTHNTFIQGSLPTGVRSYVTVTNAVISLNSVGIINNPMDVQYAGYWIYEKAANMLPYNYVP